MLPEIAKLLADEAKLPYETPLEEEKREELLSLFYNDDLKFEDGRACIDCHDIDSEDEGSAPDLTGYGSRGWLIAFIENPEDKRFYGKKNDRMPCYGRDSKLKPEEIELIADWIRGQPGQF